MRKTLLTMLASLALCGAGTAALVMSSANAQPSAHKPMMVAQADAAFAQNGPPGPPRGPGLRDRGRGDFAGRLQQMCEENYARQTGRFAYLETRLNLTASQRPAFERWKTAMLDVAKRHQTQCGERPAAQRQAQDPQGPRGANRPSPADRLAREEDRLRTRLADIQAERPALETFYNALSPEQKLVLARGERGGARGQRGRPRFAQNGPRGPMGPQGMGRGPMGRPTGPPPADGPPER